jgi:cyclophilin family peptidyl-prolyl cis-trans isomerase
VAITALVVMVLYTAYQASRRDDGDNGDDRADASEDASDTTNTTDEDGAVATTLADSGSPVAAQCPPEDGPEEPVRTFAGEPPTCIDPDRTYVATVETTRGDFEITLDAAAAPGTVNNFVFLSRWRFYEGAAFYRVVPGLSIGTGDPIAQNGTGDPGYTIDDELPTQQPFYPPMSVRMTNRGEPNTNESEFSIVTGTAASADPPRYSYFGRITAGEDVVRAIEDTGDSTSDTGVPREETVIEQITIHEE